MKWIICLLCLFMTSLAQQAVQIPEPNWNAFPVPIVDATTQKIAEFPIDTSLTQFQSLKREINTDVLFLGNHAVFAANKTVYQITNGQKRSLEFAEPLFRVITDWQSRLFVITQKRWVHIIDVNTLKTLVKFQAKYDQVLSDVAYLPNNVVLVGFNFWGDNNRKIRNPIVAAAYNMNGKEIWNIKNTLNANPVDSDHFSYEFEILQVGTRGFIANCCNAPKDDIQEGFVYESKNGQVKVKNVTYQGPPGAFFGGKYVNLDDPDTYYGRVAGVSIVDLYNFKFLVNQIGLPDAYSTIPDIEKGCKALGLDPIRSVTKSYHLSSWYNKDCSGKLYIFDRVKNRYLDWSKPQNCMREKYGDRQGSNVNEIKIRGVSYFIDPFTFSFSKIVKDEISTSCIYSFDKTIFPTDEWKEHSINLYKWSNDSFLIRIENRILENNSQDNLIYSNSLQKLLKIKAKRQSVIQGDFLLEIDQKLNLKRYKVAK